MDLIQADRNACTQCGICRDICPLWLIDFQPEGYPKPTTSAEADCITCGQCVAVCPNGSLTHREMPVEKCAPIKQGFQITADQCEELIKSRRSIRVYKDQPVSREIIFRLIEIARYGPTGHNNQNVEWLVIDKRETLQRLEEIFTDFIPKMVAPFNLKEILRHQQTFKNALLREAPVLIVTHASKNAGGAKTSADIALSYLDLAAKSMGLGCCWAGFLMIMANSFPPAKELLSLPIDNIAQGCVMLGYPKFGYQRIPLRKEPKIVWHS